MLRIVRARMVRDEVCERHLPFMSGCAVSDVSVCVDNRHRVLIKLLPQAAWRLLIDYLMFDRWFCHSIIPHFRPFGYVMLCISEPHTDGTLQTDRCM